MEQSDIETYLKEKKKQVDRALDEALPESGTFPPRLHQAMRYCLFAGGKRLRPILALASAEAVGGSPEHIVNEACALELIHTYSLIHDDLPAMDNDDYRRGCPATHKKFGEGVAVLAGDALLTEAFRVLSGGLGQGRHTPEKMLAVIRLVADACGSNGIIGGQVVDLESERKAIDQDTLEYIHTHKTGRLIEASVMMGGVLAGGNTDQLRCLKVYSSAIGLVFQITDDILDVLGSTEALGKEVGSDTQRGKATYPGIMGMDEAQRMQKVLYRKAVNAIETFDNRSDPLREIARIIIERNK